MGPPATAAVGLALALDALAGEFPEPLHPVALFGRLVEAADRPWPAPGLAGVAVALGLPLGAAAAVGGVVAAAALAGPAAGAVAAGLALFATTSRRMLLSVAGDVIDRTERDLAGARTAVVALVGRDAADLSAGQVRSAAVESAAENLADGLVAPLLAFAIGAHGSLALGAAAAAWVKAVNTLDSVLGYPSKPVGRASARLDDAVMWLPARAAAVLIAAAGRSAAALGRARSWRGDPASPNSGWPMATLAAVIDVELSKPGAYALNAGTGLPTAEQARAGVAVVGRAGLASALVAGVVAWP